MNTAAVEPQRGQLSVSHLILVVPWVALVIGAWRPMRDNSFLWHIRAGTVQADQNAVLTVDPFSFTAFGEPWRTQSWLIELLYGWAENLSAGLGFVPLMLLLVSGLTFVAIGLIGYRLSHSVPATALILILTTVALVSFFVPRPVLFSYLLMALVVLTWERPGARWALPLLFWVWAAVHASFVIGLAYLGLSLIMRREWRYLPTAIVSGLATLATAHGLGIVTFLLDFRANSGALEYLSEWRPPELFEPLFLPVLVGVILIVVGAFRGRILPRHLWLLVPFLMLGLSSVRAVPPAWLGLVPLVALSLEGVGIGSRAKVRPAMALILLIGILGLPFLVKGDGELSGERFPVVARSQLDELPTFHDDRIGGFLIWAEGPDRKVYIDDRAELYGSRLGEMVMIRRGELDWEPVFARDGIEQVLLASDELLIAWVQASGEWETAYKDDAFTVLRPARTEE